MQNGNNENVTQCITTENPDLFCILVDDLEIPTTQNGWGQDPWTAYSLNCNLEVQESELTAQFYIYPNPASDIIFIKNLEGETINFISIIDTYGRSITKRKYTSNGINISTLKSGVYFVKITTDSASITERFIKE